MVHHGSPVAHLSKLIVVVSGHVQLHSSDSYSVDLSHRSRVTRILDIGEMTTTT